MGSQAATIAVFGRSVVGVVKKSKVVSRITWKLFVKKEAFGCTRSAKIVVIGFPSLFEVDFLRTCATAFLIGQALVLCSFQGSQESGLTSIFNKVKPTKSGLCG